MKKVKKDGRRQARRERTLQRLEALLSGGIRTLKAKGEKIRISFGALSQERIDQINAEVLVLKQRLGRGGSGDPVLKAYKGG